MRDEQQLHHIQNLGIEYAGNGHAVRSLLIAAAENHNSAVIFSRQKLEAFRAFERVDMVVFLVKHHRMRIPKAVDGF